MSEQSLLKTDLEEAHELRGDLQKLVDRMIHLKRERGLIVNMHIAIVDDNPAVATFEVVKVIMLERAKATDL